jgi:AraC family transcriptional regulator, arabinose operon regulatory protein
MLFPDIKIKRDLVYRTFNPYTSNKSLDSAHGDEIGCGLLPKPEEKNFKTNFNYSNIYTLVYLLQGEGVYLSENGDEIKLTEGCLFHRFPGIPHQTIPKWNGMWVEFFVAMPKSIYDITKLSGIVDPQQPVWKIGREQKVIDEMQQIQKLFKSNRLQDPLIGIEKMLRLVRIAWECYNQINGLKNDPIEKACQFFNDKINAKKTIDDIAELVNMKSETFRKQFKQKIGVSPGNYWNRCKTDSAMNLLINSDMSIASIADTLGYSDTFSFSHQFKKKMNLSPIKYRQNYR